MKKFKKNQIFLFEKKRIVRQLKTLSCWRGRKQFDMIGRGKEYNIHIL
jgi:hypothetical protein